MNSEALKSLQTRLAVFVALLALAVVMLGGFTRLTDAGLGCPDWPGCYGRLLVPDAASALHAFPGSSLESGKAWTEMVHRYFAGTLGFLIALQAVLAVIGQRRGIRSGCCLPGLLLVLVVFQALLGMWTVTLKLLPVVVMGHLVGGMLIFSCQAVYACRLWGWRISLAGCCARAFAALVACVVLIQVALGGWVSANYAGLACNGFPLCNGHWWLMPDFSGGFHLLSPVGENYQGGLLDAGARISIQFVHRMGALSAFVLVLLQSVWLMLTRERCARAFAVLSALLVVLQATLGIINVTRSLPLWSAVLHNGVAALLLASVLAIALLPGREGN